MSARPAVIALSMLLTGAAALARNAPAPLDACAWLTEADALAMLPGATRVQQQASAAQSAEREVSGCAYRDEADPSRFVALSAQRFPVSVPSSIGWALFNDHELEHVKGVARGALWKPSTATMMLTLEREFITLTVNRPDAPATMEEVRALMAQVYERRGTPESERGVTTP